MELEPGDRLRVPGLATFTVAAAAFPLPGAKAVVRLSWERLAVMAADDEIWDVVTSVGAPAYQRRSCPACGGSGACPDPWRWRADR